MSPPVNVGESADSSDDESFVSASAISPSASKGPASAPAPKPALRPKPATAQSVVASTIRNAAGLPTQSTSGSATAPTVGLNARIASRQSPATSTPSPASPALAVSPSSTRTASATRAPLASTSSSARPPAVKPKPTIRLAPVSRSHFANNPLPSSAQLQEQGQSPSRIIAAERYVTSPQSRTESKRFTTPPPGSTSNVVSQRLGSSTSSTQPIPIITRPGAHPTRTRPSSQGRIPNSYDASLHQSVNSIGMSVDSLANAMVAGALATSAATSRSQSRDILRPNSTGSLGRPPPPPPARRSGTSLFDKLTPGHSRHGSRAGSPTKDGNGKRQMKTTLRKAKTDSEGEEDGRHGRHRKRNLVKKHPNKHHEGDRKRWRDLVTERERKRYEGLWASNKGICMGEPVRNPGIYVNPNESTVSLAGSYGGSIPPESLPGSSPGGMAMQALGRRISPYQNPTISQSQAQCVEAGPYLDSVQNISMYSLATTTGSNSGINSSPQRPSRYTLPPPRTISPPEPHDCVSSLVVRDIWSRSRLPADILREVWDLVDRSGQGMLCKDEFCAGLWLIDQRLKGRKLPQRVGDSVWRSLGGLSGVKVRDFKGRDKVRVVSGGR